MSCVHSTLAIDVLVCIKIVLVSWVDEPVKSKVSLNDFRMLDQFI